MLAAQPLRGQFRPLILAAVVGLAAIAAVWAVTFERVSYERRVAIDDAFQRNSNLAIAFEQHTVLSIKAIDQALGFIVRAYRQEGRALDLAEMIESGMVQPDVLIHVDVLDANGISIRDPTRPSGADRDFFKLHRDAAVGGGLAVGRPTVGRVTGRPTIHFTRRIDLRGGVFGGVALASVDPEYFAAFYRSVSLGRDGMLLLVGRDGFVRAWRSGPASGAGQDMRSNTLLRHVAERPVGNFVSRGRLDGASRHVSYRALREPPLVVAVGTSVQEAMATFHARERNYYPAASLATALVLLFGAGIMRAQARDRRAAAERKRSEMRLRESEWRFRDMLSNVELVSLMLDRDARIAYCNDYLLRLTGWTREEVIGRDWFELFIPAPRAGQRALFAALLAGQPGALHYENEILTKSGGRRLIRWNNTVLRSAPGEVTGTANIGEDITERKAAEDRLRDQLDELSRFQKVTVDRELRMQELKAELRAAKTRLPA